MKTPKVTKQTQNLLYYFVYALATVGLVHLVSGYIGTLITTSVSVAMIGVLGFGVFWLGNVAQRKDFTSKDAMLAIGLIVAVIVLFNFVPGAIPQNMSLFTP